MDKDRKIKRFLRNYKKKADSKEQSLKDGITLKEAACASMFGIRLVIENGHVQGSRCGA